MPVLPNPRHEAFAQALARGKNATGAGRQIGLQIRSQQCGHDSRNRPTLRLSATVIDTVWHSRPSVCERLTFIRHPNNADRALKPSKSR
jgi:hypothetical protein